jgi:hypothetical protein
MYGMVWYLTAKEGMKDLTTVLKIIRICPPSVQFSMNPPVTCWYSATFPAYLYNAVYTSTVYSTSINIPSILIRGKKYSP